MTAEEFYKSIETLEMEQNRKATKDMLTFSYASLITFATHFANHQNKELVEENSLLKAEARKLIMIKIIVIKDNKGDYIVDENLTRKELAHLIAELEKLLHKEIEESNTN